MSKRYKKPLPSRDGGDYPDAIRQMHCKLTGAMVSCYADIGEDIGRSKGKGRPSKNDSHESIYTHSVRQRARRINYRLDAACRKGYDKWFTNHAIDQDRVAVMV